MMKYIIFYMTAIKTFVSGLQIRGQKGDNGVPGKRGADGVNGMNGEKGAKGSKGERGVASYPLGSGGECQKFCFSVLLLKLRNK